MVLQSGAIPYDYATALPVRVGVTGGPRIGVSGSFYEQAAFVLIAEARRYWGILNPLPTVFEFFGRRFAKYVEGNHDAARVSLGPGVGQFRGSGEITEVSNTDELFSVDRPPGGAWIIDWIRDLRWACERQFADIATDIAGAATQQTVKQDYLSHLYPNSPSGGLGEWTHRMPFQQNDLTGTSSSGAIREMDLDLFGQGVLGGSGVLYDIDIGEVMFQPYPHLLAFTRTQLFKSAASDAPDANITPCFPAFQKSNGSIVTSTSRDTEFVQANAISQHTFDHLPSGYIRIDGDLLIDGTEYFLHPEGDENDVSATSQFNHQVDGVRKFQPGTSQSPNNKEMRSFITPTAQSVGQYQIIAKNPRSTFPQIAIESGQISKGNWEVFDDALCLFHSSGLAVISPYSGETMYMFSVEQTQHSETSSLNATGSEANLSWGSVRFITGSDSNYGFIESDGSNLYKWLGVSTVSVGAVMLDPLMHIYDNSTFDHDSEVTGDTFNYAASIDDPSSVGFWRDGSDFFASFDQANSSPKVFKFLGTSLGLFEPNTGAFATGYHPDVDNGGNQNQDTFKARIIGSKTIAWQVTDGTGNGPSGSGTAEITYDDSNTRDFPPVENYPIYIVSNPKELRIAPASVGLSESTNFQFLSVQIVDVREVSGGTSVTDGVWFLVRVITNFFGPSTPAWRHYFVRATETASTWEAQEVIRIQGWKSTSTDQPNPISFLHLDLP